MGGYTARSNASTESRECSIAPHFSASYLQRCDMEQPTVPLSMVPTQCCPPTRGDLSKRSVASRLPGKRGERPAIEAYLPDEPQGRQGLLNELVHVEMELRLMVGETARAEEYLTRFPELVDADEYPISLAVWEFRLRRRSEQGLSADEYVHRFPQFSERIRRAIEQLAAEETVSILHPGPGDIHRTRQQPVRDYVGPGSPSPSVEDVAQELRGHDRKRAAFRKRSVPKRTQRRLLPMLRQPSSLTFWRLRNCPTRSAGSARTAC